MQPRLCVALCALAVGCGGAARKGPETEWAHVAEVRFFAGGDARDDHAHVLPWAFREAKKRGARAFLFLGDMELSPSLDRGFEEELGELDPMPFFPVVGNHEVKLLGMWRLPSTGPFAPLAAEPKFQRRFLGTARTPVVSVFPDRVVYSTDLDGGVHFVALDNVSQKGFGQDQIEWLVSDLERAMLAKKTKHVIVGMHKPLAENPITTHAMDIDGTQAIQESRTVKALFEQFHVTLVLASHAHLYAWYQEGGVTYVITGGLGAPLFPGPPERAFHHVLQLDVTDAGIHVTPIPFEGPRIMAPSDREADEGTAHEVAPPVPATAAPPSPAPAKP